MALTQTFMDELRKLEDSGDIKNLSPSHPKIKKIRSLYFKECEHGRRDKVKYKRRTPGIINLTDDDLIPWGRLDNLELYLMRKQKKVTIHDICEHLGMTPGKYQRIERDRERITKWQLEKLAKMYGVHMGHFIIRKADMDAKRKEGKS